MNKLRIRLVGLGLTCSLATAIFFHTQKNTYYPPVQMTQEASPEISVPEAPKEEDLNLIVQRGDTFNLVLLRAGLDKETAQSVIKALGRQIDPRDLKVGQALKLHVRYDGDRVTLLSLSYKPSLEEEINLQNQEGSFEALLTKIPLRKITRHVDGTIKSSFYAAAQKVGAPPAIVREAIKALSGDVNWQFDPKTGNAFEIVYEAYVNDKDEVVKHGDLQYVAFAPQGKLHRVYRYKSKNEPVGYYTPQGESHAKGLLKTPLEGSKIRVTSKFSGARHHPLLHYTRAHKGVDFGAPQGTPVFAAGDGAVEVAGSLGTGYGKAVKLRHAGGYQTVYAHLSQVLCKKGQKVRQGQLIGKVGMTGHATGPHLHHELIHNGKHVNPLTVMAKLPAQKLSGKEYQAFVQHRQHIDHYVRGIAPENHATLRPVSAIRE